MSTQSQDQSGTVIVQVPTGTEVDVQYVDAIDTRDTPTLPTPIIIKGGSLTLLSIVRLSEVETPMTDPAGNVYYEYRIYTDTKKVRKVSMLHEGLPPIPITAGIPGVNVELVKVHYQ